MEGQFLKTVGEIAGIGGLAIGVVLLVFGEIIRKAVFPQLTQEQAFKLLRSIGVMTWSVAIIGIAAWVWTGRPSPISSNSGVTAGHDINARDVRVEGRGQSSGNSGVAAGHDLKANDITVDNKGQAAGNK